MTLTKNRNLWDKFWKDDKNNLTLWLTPNLPLTAWFIATIGSHVFNKGIPRELLGVIAFGSIFTWAYLEIRFGNSYFRKILGLVVLTTTILNRI